MPLLSPESSVKIFCDIRGDVTDRTGYIKSAGYPAGYQPNSDCTVSFYLNRGETLQIIFHRFNLEARGENLDICVNYMYISDGGTLIEPMCKLPFGTVFNSTTSQVILNLRSDNSVEATGFLFEYRGNFL